MDIISIEKQINRVLLQCRNATIVTGFGSGCIDFVRSTVDEINSLNNKNIVFFYDCSFGEKYFEESLESFLYKYTKKNWSCIKQANLLIEKGYKITIILSEYKFEFKEIGRLANFISEIKKGQSAIITILLQSDYYDIKYSRFNNPPIISRRLFFYPYFNNLESTSFIKSFAKKLKVKLTPKDIRAMIEYAGGIKLIYENLIELKMKYLKITGVINSKEVKNLINIIWNYLSENEKLTLNILDSKNNLNTNSEVIESLIELGFIDKDKKIKALWMKDILIPQKLRKFYIRSKQLYWGYYDLSSLLSVDEYLVLNRLFFSRSTFLAKEEVYKLRYKSSLTSEYALSKFVFRLKNKLKNIGIPSETIINVWGKGYTLKTS